MIATEDKQVKAQRSWAAGGVHALVGSLPDGDVMPAKWLGKYGGGACDTGRPLPKSSTNSLRFGNPLLAESGRSRDESIPAPVKRTVQGLFNANECHAQISPSREQGDWWLVVGE
jgi:hypothetical protein